MKTDLASAFSENGRISGEIFSQIWSTTDDRPRIVHLSIRLRCTKRRNAKLFNFCKTTRHMKYRMKPVSTTFVCLYTDNCCGDSLCFIVHESLGDDRCSPFL